jgi:hypothetical protein
MTDIEVRILQIAAELLEQARGSADGSAILCPALQLDNGRVNLGRIEHDMQFVGTRRRAGAPRYMLRMFIQRVGDDRQERDKLGRDYKIRFRTEIK